MVLEPTKKGYHHSSLTTTQVHLLAKSPYNVREKVVCRELEVQYICSMDQLADLFTKGLYVAQFQLLINKLPIVSRPLRLGDAHKQSQPSQM